MNKETQTALLSDCAALCKRATDLFGEAGILARKANAIGALEAGFDIEAFAGTLEGITPLDAAGVFAFLSKLEELINAEVTIDGNKIVLGTAVIRMGLGSR